MSAANALLLALCSRLAADPVVAGMIGPQGIRDRLVPNGTFPAVVVGDLVSNDLSTDDDLCEEHLLTLELWSQATGRNEVERLAEAVRHVLPQTLLPTGSGTLVNARLLSTKTRREPKTKLFIAEMRWRFLID